MFGGLMSQRPHVTEGLYQVGNLPSGHIQRKVIIDMSEYVNALLNV